MVRAVGWMAGIGAGLLALLLLAVAVLHGWLGRETVRAQLQRQAQDALGVPVAIERLGLGWWSGPALAAEGLTLATQPALQLRELRLRPAWGALARGRLELDAVALRGLTLPLAGIQALSKALGRPAAPAAGTVPMPLPRRLLLQEVRLEGAGGQFMLLDARALLDDDLWPAQLELEVLQGRLAGSHLQLQRQSPQRWQLRLAVAGGTVQGPLDLVWPQRPGGEYRIQGELQTRAVELSQLTAPQPRPEVWARQPLAGRLEAQTVLQARARQLGGLLDALVTQSSFTVQQAVLQGVDLVKAVQTVGVSRGGRTVLETLAGQVTTRGKTVELHNLVASAGPLSASGQVQVSAQQELSGRVQVALGGAVAVPLLVGGTVDDPQVSLTAGAKIGAAIGTLLMPGVGTGAGASVGGKLGEWLGK